MTIWVVEGPGVFRGAIALVFAVDESEALRLGEAFWRASGLDPRGLTACEQPVDEETRAVMLSMGER